MAKRSWSWTWLAVGLSLGACQAGTLAELKPKAGAGQDALKASPGPSVAPSSGPVASPKPALPSVAPGAGTAQGGAVKAPALFLPLRLSPNLPIALVGPQGNELLANDGGSLLAKQGAALLANDGGSLLANDGGGLLANDGGGLLAKDASNLLANDGGGLLANDGGGLLANDGGGLLANDGGGIVAAGAGNYRLAQVVAQGEQVATGSQVDPRVGQLGATQDKLWMLRTAVFSLERVLKHMADAPPTLGQWKRYSVRFRLPPMPKGMVAYHEQILAGGLTSPMFAAIAAGLQEQDQPEGQSFLSRALGQEFSVLIRKTPQGLELFVVAHAKGEGEAQAVRPMLYGLSSQPGRLEWVSDQPLDSLRKAMPGFPKLSLRGSLQLGREGAAAMALDMWQENPNFLGGGGATMTVMRRILVDRGPGGTQVRLGDWAQYPAQVGVGGSAIPAFTIPYLVSSQEGGEGFVGWSRSDSVASGAVGKPMAQLSAAPMWTDAHGDWPATMPASLKAQMPDDAWASAEALWPKLPSPGKMPAAFEMPKFPAYPQ